MIGGKALWKAGEKYEIGPFGSDHTVAKEDGLYLGVVAIPWAHPPTTQQCHLCLLRTWDYPFRT